jgi:hypothetical protein
LNAGLLQTSFSYEKERREKQEARSKKQETAREEKGAAHSYKKLNA